MKRVVLDTNIIISSALGGALVLILENLNINELYNIADEVKQLQGAA